jgi:hypothetical protein
MTARAASTNTETMQLGIIAKSQTLKVTKQNGCRELRGQTTIRKFYPFVQSALRPAVFASLRCFLRLSIIIILLFPLAALSQPAAVPELAPAEGPEAGQALAAEIRALRPQENVQWSGLMKTFGRSQPVVSVPITCHTTLSETNWTVTYETGASPTTPSEKFTVVFTTNGPPQYSYRIADLSNTPLGELKPLTALQANIPLAGSDFWLSDLAFQFYHWPGQVRKKGEMRRGKPCYVLESTPGETNAGGYSKVITWVEKESGAPIQAEAYGPDKKVWKEFELGSIAKVHGVYQVKNLKMFNHKTGSRTELDFELK